MLEPAETADRAPSVPLSSFGRRGTPSTGESLADPVPCLVEIMEISYGERDDADALLGRRWIRSLRKSIAKGEAACSCWAHREGRDPRLAVELLEQAHALARRRAPDVGDISPAALATPGTSTEVPF